MTELTYIGEDDGDFCIFEHADDGNGKHVANIGCQLQAVSETPEELIAFDVDKKWAQIFTDAGNVFGETGLTPRELLEHRNELLDAVKLCMGWINNWDPDFADDPYWFGEDRPKVEAAIANSEKPNDE